MAGFPIFSSRRVRSTPFTSRVEAAGLTSYTVYNHMLLPTFFTSLDEEYNHLKEHVQVWDVAAERQIEIKGKDAYQLVQLMTCRDLSKAKAGKCYYSPIIDENGGMINDPVILKFDDERWWISIADSDLMLFAKGLAIGKTFDVSISEPDVNIMAVQGPKAFNLLEKICKPDSKYYIIDKSAFKLGNYNNSIQEFINSIPFYGQAFVNGDCSNSKNICKKINRNIFTFGLKINNAVSYTHLTLPTNREV